MFCCKRDADVSVHVINFLTFLGFKLYKANIKAYHCSHTNNEDNPMNDKSAYLYYFSFAAVLSLIAPFLILYLAVTH